MTLKLAALKTQLVDPLSGNKSSINPDGSINIGTPYSRDSRGRLYVIPVTHSGIPNQFLKSVAVTDTLILNANYNRRFLLLQNQDATNPIWIAFGKTAVATGACTQIAAGGNLILRGSEFVPYTSVRGISTGNTVNVNVLEG